MRVGRVAAAVAAGERPLRSLRGASLPEGIGLYTSLTHEFWLPSPRFGGKGSGVRGNAVKDFGTDKTTVSFERNVIGPKAQQFA